jgi:hypothetical protein
MAFRIIRVEVWGPNEDCVPGCYCNRVDMRHFTKPGDAHKWAKEQAVAPFFSMVLEKHRATAYVL